jgi:tRNA(Arg) A34 adenosine deaminase TadA
MKNDDEKFLRLSFEVALEALNNGNHPFGAILVDEHGKELLRAGNSIEDDNDTTAHAETNLIRLTWGKYDQKTLAKCTLYSSAEPCAMCSGAIYWSGIGRIVFGLSIERQAELTETPEDFAPVIRCAEIIGKGKKQIVVEDPLLKAEAEKIYMSEADGRKK